MLTLERPRQNARRFDSQLEDRHALEDFFIALITVKNFKYSI